MPAATSVQNWLKDDREGFRARYREAREVGYHAIADEMLTIVDDRRNDWIVRRRRRQLRDHPRSRVRQARRSARHGAALAAVEDDAETIRQPAGQQRPQKAATTAIRLKQDEARMSGATCGDGTESRIWLRSSGLLPQPK
jgi:hypothetical protein